MKRWIVLLIAIGALAAGWLLRSFTPNKSPITEAAHRKFDQHMKKIAATAESMPANRYAYAPADSDTYFLMVANQVVDGIQNRCALLLNLKSPDFSKALPPVKGPLFPDAIPKQFKSAAIKQLKDVTEICDQTFGLLNDAQLNEVVTSQGDPKATKAEVLMDLLGEMSEAESKMDMYLQLQAGARRNLDELAPRITAIPSSPSSLSRKQENPSDDTGSH